MHLWCIKISLGHVFYKLNVILKDRSSSLDYLSLLHHVHVPHAHANMFISFDGSPSPAGIVCVCVCGGGITITGIPGDFKQINCTEQLLFLTTPTTRVANKNNEDFANLQFANLS